MTARKRLVILGGGLTGHSAAMAARHNGYDGEITIISDEQYAPYDRTPLSKAVLQGERETTDLGLLPGADYADHEIQLMLGATAEQVDLDNRRIRTNNGDEIPFDDLLIATGARPIRLPLPGFDLENVYELRTVSDGESIKAALQNAERVVVVGAGFIGSEVAASARTLGKQVTLVDMFATPMSGALPPEVSALCAEIHRDQGVILRMESQVTELRGTGRVEEAVLADGTRIECDMVVVGVGVRPNVELFAGTELQIENGIVVDEYCRASVPGVYAAGDVANWWNMDLERHIRIEHFDNAGAQGTFVGKVIAGIDEGPFAPVPYFWSDQYDTNIQYAGYHFPGNDVYIRGNPDERAITVFCLHDGTLRAAITVNQAREFRSVRRLVAAKAVIEPEILCDPDTDIRKLSREYR